MQFRNNNMYMPTDKGSLSVHGASYIEVNSDRARLKVKISTDNTSLEKAQDTNKEVSDRVLMSLKDYGISKENIHSEDLSVSKNYDLTNNKFLSYKVTNVISIFLDDFNKLGDVYSLIIENGANDEISVDFILSNPTQYYNRVLKKATQDALNKAGLLAKSFNVKYNPTPNKITELSSPIYAITYPSSSSSYYKDIAPGIVKITAEVEAVFTTFPF
ncbi:SIMPL domain-containing protein [Romboutsia lituseburensis]|uniref:SIMPL domain-containing protein n=1 Tax=Romboutsia lituseburensis TaxID=1537 RepID=UPI00215AA09E|nr:SIMPL domain-containing protein [Romboutsia lituseburensis]MCR8746629.1 SIMPL domain-containing protein [Romboutsia lituseburensis]